MSSFKIFQVALNQYYNKFNGELNTKIYFFFVKKESYKNCNILKKMLTAVYYTLNKKFKFKIVKKRKPT